MLQNWKLDLILFIRARTGVTLALFVWSALVALASLTAFAFLCVVLYDWLSLQLNGIYAGLVVAGLFAVTTAIGVSAGMMARRRARARALREQAAQAHAPARLFDPQFVGLAFQAGRAFGWRRVMPIALLAFVAAQLARQYHAGASGRSR